MTIPWPSAVAASAGLAALGLSGGAIGLARLLAAWRADRARLSGRVDDLSARIEALEARLTPRPARRVPSRRSASVRRDPAPPGPLIAVPSLGMPGSEAVATEAAAELGRRFGGLWAMADAGASPRAIAEATGHPIGQVELILGLRRPTPTPTPTPTGGGPDA